MTNQLACVSLPRMSLLLKLTLARGGSYFVEQPSSSVLRWYPRFADLGIDCADTLLHFRGFILELGCWFGSRPSRLPVFGV